MTTLHDEIHNDPASKGYMAFLPASPGTVADMLNAPTETMVKALRTTTAKAWAATGPMSAIVDASAKAVAPATDHPCRASCLTLLESMRSGDPIHVEMSDVRGMLDAWVATGICTATQRADLLARATVPASRMEVLGLPAATINDVIGAI